MVEALSKKLEHERRMERLLGFNFEHGIKEINHSQFVDDTLLMGATSTIIAKKFKRTLDTFLRGSRGKVNNHKSKLYG
jgi:hypothetical protein